MQLNNVGDNSRARDFDFTDRDFERVRALIYDSAGISLSAAKRDNGTFLVTGDA